MSEPRSDICSRCHMHAGFERDEDGVLVSVCCGWPMWDPTNREDT